MAGKAKKTKGAPKAPNRVIEVKPYKRKFNAAKLPPRTSKGRWRTKARQGNLF